MLLRWCLTLLVLAANAAAFDFSALKPEGYVSDFARVMSTASKVELERYCQALEEQTGVQIALVTLPSLENEPASDVANLLFRTWGIGQKKSNEGVLLLLAIRERKSRLEVGYGLEPVLPDGAAGEILRAMRPALRENHFGDAMIAAAREIGNRVVKAKKSEGTLPELRTARPRAPEGAVPIELWVFLAFVVLMFFLASRSQGRYATRRGRGDVFPVFFPPSFPGHYPRGGGGFGGMSDSGGGFGGFGGGDSGGGGASSDW